MTRNGLLAHRIAYPVARRAFIAGKLVMRCVVCRAMQAATWEDDGVT